MTAFSADVAAESSMKSPSGASSSVPTGMPEGKGSGKADGVFPRTVVHFAGETTIETEPARVVHPDRPVVVDQQVRDPGGDEPLQGAEAVDVVPAARTVLVSARDAAALPALRRRVEADLARDGADAAEERSGCW